MSYSGVIESCRKMREYTKEILNMQDCETRACRSLDERRRAIERRKPAFQGWHMRGKWEQMGL